MTRAHAAEGDRAATPPSGTVRRRGILRAVGAAGTALATLLLAAGCGSSAPPVAAPSQDVGTRLDAAVPSDILRLPLVDQDGHRTDLAAFRGKVLVISDTMTLCQETCPLDTADLVQTARVVDGAHQGSGVEFLTISIDPERDTPAQLAAYRRQYAPTPSNWQALTGSPADIAALWKYFGVYTKKVPEGSPPARNWRTGQPLTYDLDHTDGVFFLDARGHERFLLDGAGYVAPGTPLPPAMRAYLDADGRKNLKNPDPGTTWTVPQALQVVSWLVQHPITEPSAS